MSSLVSSFPFIMFHDDKIKLLRIVLRGFFIAESVDGPFYMKRDNHWTPVLKDVWHNEITTYISRCCTSNNINHIDRRTVSKAICCLYNENAYKRVSRYIR